MPGPSPDPKRAASNRGTSREPFGTTVDGREVERFTLTSASGVSIAVLSFGGVIQSILAPDRAGELADITLGYDTLPEYEKDKSYLGALVGRYANRIRGGRFSLDGRDYALAQNAGGNHLHGGMRGFNKAVWSVDPFEESDAVGLVLQHVSPDGDEGYPGTLRSTVTYRLTASGELAIDFSATSDAATPANLTQHAYFNLALDRDVTISDHRLRIDADYYTPVDDELIPTGELNHVEGTAFDFRTLRRIGDVQYDHNWVIRRADDVTLTSAAHLHDPATGRTLDVITTQPGLQFYSGNFLDGRIIGRDGIQYRARMGLCLETQHFPDSPNRPEFPSTTLRKGEEFASATTLHFGIER